MKCDRCYTDAIVTTGSMFNADTICLECQRVEQAHPAFEAARRREAEECAWGNYNFPGVGLPDDLRVHRTAKPADYVRTGKRFVVEASELRLPPGHWPRRISLDGDVFTLETVSPGDARRYRDRHGFALLVLND